MNDLMAFDAAKMNSVEIADLVESRHADIKRSIKRLVEKGVIRQPPTAFLERINNLGFKVKDEVYIFEGEQGKRDSIVVVAQNCPEFTARLVDRWQELEEQVRKPVLPDFTDPVAAARAWADEVEQRLLAQQREKEALEYVDRQARYIDNLENQLRDGLTLPEFAKRLNGVNVQRVSEWAISKGWVRRHGKLLVTSSQGRSGGYVYDKDGTYINPKTGEEMYTSKVQLTNAGARKMYREYLKLNLPMKKSWNGEFSNSPFKD